MLRYSWFCYYSTIKITMLFGVLFGPTLANDNMAKTYHEVKSFLDKHDLGNHVDFPQIAMTGVESGGMTDLWTESFLKAVPILKAKMNELKRKDEERIKHLERILQNEDVPKLKKTLKDFIQDLLMHYKGLVTQQLVKTHDGSDESTMKDARQNHYGMAYHAKDYGKTLKDEYNAFPCDRAQSRWISEIMPNLTVSSNSYLATLLPALKIGAGSFRRSLMVLKYLALKRHFDEVSEQDINNIADGQDASKGKAFPTDQVMFQLWETQIHTLSNGVQWYLLFEEDKFFKYFEIPWDYMTGPNSDYAIVNGMKEFKEKVMAELWRNMHKKFEKVYEMWDDDVARATRNKRLDHFVKHAMMLMTSHVEDMFTKEQDLQVADVTKKEEDPDLYDDKASYFQQKPRSGQAIPVRHSHKMKRLHAFVDHIAQIKQGISIEDICMGGFARLKHQERGAVNYDYIRSVAYTFYVSSVVNLLEFLESSLEAQVFDYLVPREQTDLQKTMLQFVDDMGEEELKGYLPVDIPSMEKEKNEAQSRIQEIDKLLPSLSKLLRSANKLIERHPKEPEQRFEDKEDEDGQ